MGVSISNRLNRIEQRLGVSVESELEERIRNMTDEELDARIAELEAKAAEEEAQDDRYGSKKS